MNPTKECLISIIIPIYNREETLKRCIDSVLNASYQNIEVILVDDGSTDSSWDIIQSYSDNRVKSVHIANGGLSVARNVGIGMASGDYIHFVDSDDFVEKDTYSTCIKAINEFLPDILLFDYSVYFDSSKDHYRRGFDAIPKYTLLDRKYILENLLPVVVNIDDRKELYVESYVWNKLYKRHIIEKNHIRFDESRRRWEDRLFLASFLKNSESFYYIPVQGYYYVMGHSAYSQSYDKMVFDMVLRGREDYEKVVGDLYDLKTEYSDNYYCKVFIDTVLQQFTISSINEAELKEDITHSLTVNNAGQLFASFKPRSKVEIGVKKAVLAKDYDGVFELLKSEYSQRQRDKNKSSILKTLANKVKRIFHTKRR